MSSRCTCGRIMADRPSADFGISSGYRNRITAYGRKDRLWRSRNGRENNNACKNLYGRCGKRNPDGPGGYGTILSYTDPKGQTHIRELSQGYEKTTNNRMELMAVIAGLEALNRPCEVEIYSDSKYVVDAFNQHWN